MARSRSSCGNGQLIRIGERRKVGEQERGRPTKLQTALQTRTPIISFFLSIASYFVLVGNIPIVYWSLAEAEYVFRD